MINIIQFLLLFKRAFISKNDRNAVVELYKVQKQSAPNKMSENGMSTQEIIIIYNNELSQQQEWCFDWPAILSCWQIQLEQIWSSSAYTACVVILLEFYSAVCEPNFGFDDLSI